MTKYFVQKHIFFCISNEYCVILDLKRDKYICLDPQRAAYLASLLKDDSLNKALKIISKKNIDQTLENAKNSLIENGLLTKDKKDGKPDALTQFQSPTTPLIDHEHAALPHIQSSHVLKFFHASAIAFWKLRRWSLERTVQSVERRRRTKDSIWSEGDFLEASRLVAIFERLRPFFPTNYLCLFDSLALIEFLAKYGLYATWVYGVEAEPFSAHCWVQKDSILLNDAVDRIRLYTPIMVV